MARTIFILGAGASVESRAPVMATFIDAAEDLYRRRIGGIDRKAFEIVFDAIEQLQTVHSKSVLDTNNIESVFGAVEMAHLFGRLGSMDEDATRAVRDALPRMIVQTLEHSIVYHLNRDVGVSWNSYRGLAQQIAMRAGNVAVITFNYDLAVEFELHHAGVRIDYGLSDNSTDFEAVDVLKLHGSANWALVHDPEGNALIASLPIDELLRKTPKPDGMETYGHIFAGEQLSSLGSPTADRRDALIVPPTWSKLKHYDALRPVWRRAAMHLQEAENIYVIGYSLPAADQFFRLLFALGTVGRSRIRKFVVLDPAESVKRKFKGLLGQGVRGFEFDTGGFVALAKYI